MRNNKLAQQFQDGHYHYKQFKRKGNVCLYQVKDDLVGAIHYEIIIARYVKELQVGHVIFSECETYPNDYQSGEYAWVPDYPDSISEATALFDSIYKRWENNEFTEDCYA